MARKEHFSTPPRADILAGGQTVDIDTQLSERPDVVVTPADQARPSRIARMSAVLIEALTLAAREQHGSAHHYL